MDMSYTEDFNPASIDGWDQMSAEDQQTVREFYSVMREIADAYKQLDEELGRMWNMHAAAKHKETYTSAVSPDVAVAPTQRLNTAIPRPPPAPLRSMQSAVALP